MSAQAIAGVLGGELHVGQTFISLIHVEAKDKLCVGPRVERFEEAGSNGQISRLVWARPARCEGLLDLFLLLYVKVVEALGGSSHPDVGLFTLQVAEVVEEVVRVGVGMRIVSSEVVDVGKLDAVAQEAFVGHAKARR